MVLTREAKIFQREFDYARLKELKEQRLKLKRQLNVIEDSIKEINGMKYVTKGNLIMSNNLILSPIEINSIREQNGKR